MSGARFLAVSLILSSFSSYGAKLVCDPIASSAKEKVRVEVQFPLPFEFYFEPTLYEDEAKGGIVESFPVRDFPGTEFGVGTFIARGHDSFESRVLTVFDSLSPHKKNEFRFPATYLRVTTSYPADWSGPYPKNAEVKLYEMQCRFSKSIESSEKRQ